MFKFVRYFVTRFFKYYCTAPTYYITLSIFDPHQDDQNSQPPPPPYECDIIRARPLMLMLKKFIFFSLLSSVGRFDSLCLCSRQVNNAKKPILLLFLSLCAEFHLR